MDLMSFVVFLIVIGLAFWALRMLSSALGIPAPIVTVIQVVLVVIIVLFLLRLLGVWSGEPNLRL